MSNEKITLEQLLNLDFNGVIWVAAPIMFSLVLLEYLLSVKQQKKVYVGKDSLASTAVGIGNLILNGFMKTGLFLVILFFYNLTPLRIPDAWWSYILCLFVLDFIRYWAHRIAHEQRFWWSTHVVHHSSEQYNFSVSFRLSWTQNLKVVFFLPVILMGFDPIVFFVIHQIEVLYQFWIHTEMIRKLPKPIEYIFTTPSHHRVHHATNAKYIDKNYGSTFIIWDRMFGTFQPEEEQAVYGITNPVNSYNPVYLVFHAWIDVVKDLSKCRSIKSAWKILFGSPVDYDKEKVEVAEQVPVPLRKTS
jgi:sterol desaturase/sphingolipid hydroxylase (fatty acid hydroxylase superfamily)